MDQDTLLNTIVAAARNPAVLNNSLVRDISIPYISEYHVLWDNIAAFRRELRGLTGDATREVLQAIQSLRPNSVIELRLEEEPQDEWSRRKERALGER